MEVDVATFEKTDQPPLVPASGNGTAYAPPAPTLVVETDLLDTDEYEVRIFDAQRNRRLVAAIEIVSHSRWTGLSVSQHGRASMAVSNSATVAASVRANR